jgi:hypothetical protein
MILAATSCTSPRQSSPIFSQKYEFGIWLYNFTEELFHTRITSGRYSNPTWFTRILKAGKNTSGVENGKRCEPRELTIVIIFSRAHGSSTLSPRVHPPWLHGSSCVISCLCLYYPSQRRLCWKSSASWRPVCLKIIYLVSHGSFSLSPQIICLVSTDHLPCLHGSFALSPTDHSVCLHRSFSLSPRLIHLVSHRSFTLSPTDHSVCLHGSFSLSLRLI